MKEQSLSIRVIVINGLKMFAIVGVLALFSLLILESCERSGNQISPVATNSPSAAPTIPDVLTEPPGKAPPQP